MLSALMPSPDMRCHCPEGLPLHPGSTFQQGLSSLLPLVKRHSQLMPPKTTHPACPRPCASHSTLTHLQRDQRPQSPGSVASLSSA